MKNERLKETGKDLKKIGNDWDRIADKFFDIYKKGAVDLLNEIAKDVEEIYFKETQIFENLGGKYHEKIYCRVGYFYYCSDCFFVL